MIYSATAGVAPHLYMSQLYALGLGARRDARLR